MMILNGAIRSATVAARPRLLLTASRVAPIGSVKSQARGYAAHHEEESYEAFTSRYVKFFESVEDVFELQRGLNNCFAYDLVPAPEIIESALRAARRVNDYSAAVRVFEGVKEKVENSKQYDQYVEALRPVKEELGISLKEELYRSS